MYDGATLDYRRGTSNPATSVHAADELDDREYGTFIRPVRLAILCAVGAACWAALFTVANALI